MSCLVRAACAIVTVCADYAKHADTPHFTCGFVAETHLSRLRKFSGTVSRRVADLGRKRSGSSGFQVVNARLERGDIRFESVDSLIKLAE